MIRNLPLQFSNDIQYESKIKHCDDTRIVGKGIVQPTFNDHPFEKTPSNEMWVGAPNPKTLIPPVITPRIFSPEWQATSFSVPSGINSESSFDYYRSGYVSTRGDIGGKCVENAVLPERQNIKELKETFEHAEPIKGVNGENGLEYAQPINEYEEHDGYKEYNENIQTYPIQPGLYGVNSIKEPSNSMIGVTYPVQMNPSSVSEKDGNITFEQHDPLDWVSVEPEKKTASHPTFENIYDPRMTGYGDNDRMYIDNMTGQPRFYYDDINAVKMPNYIVRSNIDHILNAYGTYSDNMKIDTSKCRDLAQQAFLDATISHRSDIQERLMRKNNARMIENRKFPKHFNY